MGRLDEKVAIITGAARGQGAAEAELFAAEGAKVVLTDLLAEEGKATAQRCGGAFVRHDVSDEDSWSEVVATTLELHGQIDVLVNNAGIFLGKSMIDTTVEDFRRVVEVNELGVFCGMKAVAPAMMERQKGSIVNISSIAGLVAAPRAIAYGASKFAVTGMTKTAAVELIRYGIRVNSIHPGMIETEMIHEVVGHDQVRHDRMEAALPIRRAAEPVEVANLALYLASDESSYSTGAQFVVDGGVTAL